MNVPRILIVEDDPTQSEYLAKKVESFGYIVSDEVRTVSGAKASLSKNQIDLAIIDIVLLDNEKGGIEVAKFINKHFHIPFIFLTVQEDEELDQEAKRTGYKNFLDKPYSERQLKRAINDALCPPGVKKNESSENKPSTQIEYKKGSSWCWIKENNILQKVYVDNIYWIKGDGQYCSIFTFPKGKNGKPKVYTISHRLGIAEEALKENPDLIRINQKYIVNLTKIEKRTAGNGIYVEGLKDMLKVSGKTVPIDFWDQL
ncbi:MAG: response regulator [Bacteroidetes bacterium]|nr:MAG: response regulator [Bacteroidota bacterium]